MSLPNPLLKRIRTEDNIYIYSGKTNRIFLVTEAMDDILELYGRQSKEGIITQLEERHSVSQIEEGFEIIDRLNQQYGLFSPGGFETRIGRMTEEEVKAELSKSISSMCLEVTEACNLRCKYCVYSGGYQHTRLHGSRHMGWSIAKAAIDLLNARHHSTEKKGLNIGFYGGEPLLQFDFIKRCVEYVESLKWDAPVSFSMTTNGILLTEDVIEFMLNHRIMPTISLDGPQSEHDRNRVFPNGEGTFACVFENIENLCARMFEKQRQLAAFDRPPYILFNCVVTPGTDLVKLNEFFTKNVKAGLIADIMVIYAKPGHETFFQECPEHPRRQQQLEALSRAYHEAHLRGFDPHARENIFVKNLFESKYVDLYKRHVCSRTQDEVNLTRMCFPGKRKPYVTVDGKIHVCERINSTLPIGDVWIGFDIQDHQSMESVCRTGRHGGLPNLLGRSPLCALLEWGGRRWGVLIGPENITV